MFSCAVLEPCSTFITDKDTGVVRLLRRKHTSSWTSPFSQPLKIRLETACRQETIILQVFGVNSFVYLWCSSGAWAQSVWWSLQMICRAHLASDTRGIGCPSRARGCLCLTAPFWHHPSLFCSWRPPLPIILSLSTTSLAEFWRMRFTPGTAYPAGHMHPPLRVTTSASDWSRVSLLWEEWSFITGCHKL